MEQIKFNFNCRILRIVDDGFIALDKEYLIKFQDNKHKHFFNADDEVFIGLENVDEPRDDELKEGYSVIYCQLKNYLSNGIQFLDIKEQKKGFFWNYRGVLTHRIFENNDLWEKNSILRIMIRKI